MVLQQRVAERLLVGVARAQRDIQRFDQPGNTVITSGQPSASDRAPVVAIEQGKVAAQNRSRLPSGQSYSFRR
ncbi:hypothetical protein ACTWLT_14745 [Micromonospora sp. ZYX-F-536]|uniref:hypothetical protein n=1 Tax=Micromonospora sp. ZYX-F-536 TaxID=3457629 RepID=UPI004040B25E